MFIHAMCNTFKAASESLCGRGPGLTDPLKCPPAEDLRFQIASDRDTAPPGRGRTDIPRWYPSFSRKGYGRYSAEFRPAATKERPGFFHPEEPRRVTKGTAIEPRGIDCDIRESRDPKTYTKHNPATWSARSKCVQIAGSAIKNSRAIPIPDIQINGSIQ